MANPMNQMPEIGICTSSMTPNTTETTPEKTAQPQRGNFAIPEPIARNSPPTMKNEASTSVRASAPDKRVANEQISGESPEQRTEQIEEESAPGPGTERMNQREDAADQKHPAEDQHGSEGRGYVKCNAGYAKNGEQDSKGQKPAPGRANLLDAGNEWIVVSSV